MTFKSQRLIVEGLGTHPCVNGNQMSLLLGAKAPPCPLSA